MIYAVIDLGSNTIRLSVYKCIDGIVDVLFTKKAMIGLAGYVSDGILKKSGIEKACYTLNKFKTALKNFEIDGIYIFATASLRNVKNTNQAVRLIKEKTDFDIEILSGEEEAVLDFAGATRVVNIYSGILIDIGGGSTELVEFENGKVLKAVSMPIGSLNMYSKYINGLIPTENEKKKIRNNVLAELEKLNIKKTNYKTICGVGGSIRASSKISNDYFNLPIDNSKITYKHLKELLNVLIKSEKIGLDIILRIVPDRLRTICSGIIILQTISKYFVSEEIIVSSQGVREGYLYSRILGEAYEQL